MKTPNWSIVKKALYLMSIACMVAMTTACAKKDSNTPAVSRYRGTGYTGQGGMTTNGQQQQWGTIAVNGLNSVQAFMQNDQLDFNNCNTGNGNTGVYFRGSVGQGTIYILVWDCIAANSGQGYYFPMSVTAKNGGNVTIEDSEGALTFIGQFNGGIWSGTVTYNNSNGGNSGTLGSFSIPFTSIK